jgi:hypothetical protein
MRIFLSAGRAGRASKNIETRKGFMAFFLLRIISQRSTFLIAVVYNRAPGKEAL